MQIVLGHHTYGLSNGQTIKVIHVETGFPFLFATEPEVSRQ